MTDPLLLDQFLPTCDHEISMSQLFRAPPAEVFDAITNLDLFRLPVARVLVEARGLPGRLANAAARRHGETVVTALWKDGHLKRIDLQPLSRQDCDRLVESALDGPLDPVAAEKIWRLTRGNMLYLRHFVEQERAAGRLSPGSGTGPVETAVASSLADLIDAEMGSLSPEVGEVVDLLAVAEPLDASTLARLAEPTAVEEAESRALVSVEHTQTQARLRLAHPLYGEARRVRAGSMRLRRLRGRVAAASSGTDTRDAREIVRLAVLLLESDLEPDPAIYIRAATEAIRLSAYALAERLAHTPQPAGILRAAPSCLGVGAAAAR